MILLASLFPGQIAIDLSRDLYENNAGVMGHGAEPGTSLMLHLHPGAVRTELIPPTKIKDFQGLSIASPSVVRFGESEANLFLNVSELSETSGWSDPSQASAPRGAVIFERNG